MKYMISDDPKLAVHEPTEGGRGEGVGWCEVRRSKLTAASCHIEASSVETLKKSKMKNSLFAESE